MNEKARYSELFSKLIGYISSIFPQGSLSEEDDDYEWTPVLTNEKGEEFGNMRPFFKVGSQQFKEQDLPRFLNFPVGHLLY